MRADMRTVARRLRKPEEKVRIFDEGYRKGTDGSSMS